MKGRSKVMIIKYELNKKLFLKISLYSIACDNSVIGFDECFKKCSQI